MLRETCWTAGKLTSWQAEKGQRTERKVLRTASRLASLQANKLEPGWQAEKGLSAEIFSDNYNRLAGLPASLIGSRLRVKESPITVSLGFW